VNIMIVDDELISRKKLSIILQAYGKCFEFSDGASALEFYKNAVKENTQIGLITLDIDMPKLTGIETLGLIRDLQKAQNVPASNRPKVFMVTSMNDQKNLMNSLTQGCSDYIVKPFDEEKIIDKLHNHLLI